MGEGGQGRRNFTRRFITGSMINARSHRLCPLPPSPFLSPVHQAMQQELQRGGLDPGSQESLNMRIQALTSKLYALTGLSKVDSPHIHEST